MGCSGVRRRTRKGVSTEGSHGDQGSWSHKAEAAPAETQRGDNDVGGGRPCRLKVSCGRWQEAQTTHQKEALRLSGPKPEWRQP